MAEYNGKTGVWRTVGGRRIFIADGEDLSTAMKKSGKFKSNKKEPDYSKRPIDDIEKENRKNNKITERIEKGMDTFDPVEFEKWRQKEDPNFEMSDDGARNLYEIRKQQNRIEKNKIDKMYNDMNFKDLEETYNSLERTNGKIDDNSYEAKAIIAEYNKRQDFAKKFHEITMSMDNDNSEGKEDNGSFKMYNSDTNKTVTVSKDDDGKWVDSDGNRYMGYLSKKDVKSYFKGNWSEKK